MMAKKTESEMSNPRFLQVLMVEDSEDDALLEIRELKKGGYDPVYERVETAAAMKKALKEKQWEIILCDYKLPKFNATSAIAVLKETNIDIPVIIVSGTIGEETAVECMRLGAHDYIMKNNLSRLCPAIARELEETEVRNKQRQAEKDLRESEEKYRTILEQMDDSYFEVDLAGNFTFFNDAITRHVGYSREELIGTSFRSQVAKEDIATLYNAFGKIYSTGKPERNIFYNFMHKDGTMGSVEAAAFPLHNQKGEIVGFRGIAREITKRKQAEEALRESEEKYRLIAENTADLIVVTDMNLRFTYISPSIMRTHGFTVEEAMNMTLDQLLTPESLQTLLTVFEEEMKLEATGTADPKRIHILEIEEYKKDGSIIWIESIISAQRDKENKLIGILTANRDITERKQAEEKLALNLEIQAAMNILLGLSLEGRTIKEFLYSALDLVLSLKWLAIESKGAVFLTDKAGETLLLQVQKGLSQELCAMCSTVPFGHCLCGRAAVARSVQFADRVDERHDTHYEGMPPHGHYCIPILSGDHILGVIVLYVKEGHTRSPWEDDFLKAVANSLAGTIERRRAEEALKESEEKYRLIAENTADLIVVTDMNLRFTYISPSIMRTHGFTVEEAMNMTLDQFLTPGSMQNLLTVAEEEMKLEATGTIDPGRIRRLEIEGYKKDGSILWMEISVSNQRDKEYKPIGILAVNRDITERKRAEEERQQSFERMRKALRATVQSISMIVEMKDPYTSGHQQRVADLARSIATEMGLSADRQDFIRTASSIHDIGKIAVPAEILSKPTKLTDLEFGLIKTHSQSGYDILKDIEFPWPVADVVLQHHERMDGSGYPHGLKGENISLEARILAVADVVEAITSHRPYRAALGIDVALEDISRNRGILYDADVVDACLKLFREKGYTLVIKKA